MTLSRKDHFVLAASQLVKPPEFYVGVEETKRSIPVELSSKFSEMLVSAINEEDYAEFNNMFDQYSCDSFLNFTFKNPL